MHKTCQVHQHTHTHTHTQCTWVAKYWLLVVANSVHVLPQHTVHTVLYKYWLLLVANIVHGLTLQPVLQCALLLNTVDGKWWPNCIDYSWMEILVKCKSQSVLMTSQVWKDSLFSSLIRYSSQLVHMTVKVWDTVSAWDWLMNEHSSCSRLDTFMGIGEAQDWSSPEYSQYSWLAK